VPDRRADLMPFAASVRRLVSRKSLDQRRPCEGAWFFGRPTITRNRERQIADAKAGRWNAREGYRRISPRNRHPGRRRQSAGGEAGRIRVECAGRISDHDALLGRTLAWILSGGSLPHQTTVTEQYLLDLEREAFLKLCGERKTLERIQYTLKTGKPLRN
jgi:3-hydroxyacyl-CoA dehydrogenase